MSLQPGDVITTGTPPGVGLGHKPPVYLREGDEVHLGVGSLGEQRQRVVKCVPAHAGRNAPGGAEARPRVYA